MSFPFNPLTSECALKAGSRRVFVSESILSVRSASSRCKKPERLNEIEDYDNSMREAQFAFRSCDLKSWNSSSRQTEEVDETNSDPVCIQHWAIVVRFSGRTKRKTYIFEAFDIEGKLEATRSVAKDDTIFEESKYIGSHVTSPKELVDKAKELKCLGETYHAGIIIGLKNNCQTFVKEFLQKVHPHLLNKFFRTVPYTILT